MFSSLIKKQVTAFLSDIAQDGYTLTATSSGLLLQNVQLKPNVFLPSALPFYAVSG